MAVKAKPKPDPKPKPTGPAVFIIQRLDYVTCTQQVRGRPRCGALVWFMPGELPRMCANRHPQPQHGEAYFKSE